MISSQRTYGMESIYHTHCLRDVATPRIRMGYDFVFFISFTYCTARRLYFFVFSSQPSVSQCTVARGSAVMLPPCPAGVGGGSSSTKLSSRCSWGSGEERAWQHTPGFYRLPYRLSNRQLPTSAVIQNFHFLSYSVKTLWSSSLRRGAT